MKNPKSLQGKSNLTLFNFHQERETAENQENKKKLQIIRLQLLLAERKGVEASPYILPQMFGHQQHHTSFRMYVLAAFTP